MYAFSFYRLIFQCAKLSNQGITIVGILTTVVGYLLLTDFQAMPYDPCTEYSPFHHPEIIDYFDNTSQVSIFENEDIFSMSEPVTESVLKLKSIQFSSNVDIKINDDHLFNTNLGQTTEFKCQQVEECLCKLSMPCVDYPINANLNPKLNSQNPNLYKCTTDKGPLTLCTYISENQLLVSPTKLSTLEIASIESINVLPKDEYFLAKNNCILANVSGHQCHWTPSSTIVNNECEDCQPICRSVSQTLTFAQFSLGMGLLIYSSALQLPPIVALLTNQSPKNLQVQYYIHILCIYSCACMYPCVWVWYIVLCIQ